MFVTLHAFLRSPARFRRAEDGATAVEFGLVALPFFALVFAIFETALTFWSSQILETAVSNASRQLYTGETQTATGYATKTNAVRASEFKTAVCANVRGVFNCNSLVSIDVRTLTTFSGYSAVPSPNNNGAYDTSTYGYVSPGSNEITLVRASMQYPVLVRLPGPGGNLSNGRRLIMASTTFRTEPYQ